MAAMAGAGAPSGGKGHARLKVISMGAKHTGKSCLIKRFCEQKFESRYMPTIGVDFGVKTVVRGVTELKINFWDLSGQDEFYEVRNEFYADSQGAILVYDVTSRRSFLACDAWIREAAKHGSGIKPCNFVLCANKVDLAKKRVVTEAEGRKFAKARNFQYFEVSASSGQNVNVMFDFLFEQIINTR